MTAGDDELVGAIRDLTRVVIATSGQFESKADAIRRLNEMSIAPARIAVILDLPTKDVTSVISKARKRGKRGGNNG